MTEGVFETPLVALRAAGLNYQSLCIPLEGVLPNGERITVPNRAVVRGTMPGDPTRPVIGIVGPGYRPIQHSQLAHMLVPVAREHPLVMLGAGGTHRERVFFGFDFGQWRVRDLDSEAIQSYLYVWNANDGDTSIGMMLSEVRMACLNMFHLARRAATFHLRLRHNNDALINAQQWIGYLDRLRRARETHKEQADRLAVARIVAEQLQEIIDAAFPLPAKPRVVTMVEAEEVPTEAIPEQARARKQQWERDIERILEQRGAVLGLNEKLSDEYPQIGGTAYAAVQAVAEFNTWRGGRNAQDQLLFGERALANERAFEAALALV